MIAISEWTTESAMARIVRCVCSRWPEHARFLEVSMNERTPEVLQETIRMAELVERLAGDNLAEYVEGYRWMCDMILTEEIGFRRTGTYRFSTFSEVNSAIYQDSHIMALY